MNQKTSFPVIRSILLVVGLASPGLSQEAAPRLLARNVEAPFCYDRTGTRSWQIFDRRPRADDMVWLTARRERELLAHGQTLCFAGLSVSVDKNGKLIINARIEDHEDTEKQPLPFELEVSLQRSGQTVQSQKLHVRAAPPPRAISYVADLVDDLIRIFWDQRAGQFRKIEKSGFDQYFRRLQAHGVERLIVWQSPFPFSVDPGYLSLEDWSRYQKQATAILDSEELTQGMADAMLPSWKWVRMTMRLRLMPEFGEMFSRGASDHGIKLTASFRPLEPALTKYYEVPTFDQHGNWLWGFLPMAWPTVNYHPRRVCFANVRTILKKMNRSSEADPESIEFTDVANARTLADRFAQDKTGLRIVASHFPPIAADSFVLVRDAEGEFTLKRYSDVAWEAETHQVELSGFEVSASDDHLRISKLRVPHGYRFVIISRASESTDMIQSSVGRPIVVRSRAGNQLGRVNVYRVFAPSDPDAPFTRIAGITPTGSYRTTFQAIENSMDRLGADPAPERLARMSFVVDLGSDWSVEMLDFERAATCQIAIAQLKTMLAHSAFDEIFINTRSHCQLGATTADDLTGDRGLKPLEYYRLKHIPYRHLGIDRAFAPISLASNPRMIDLASKADTVEQITHWQENEWLAPCQSPDSPFAWRFARNRAVANGLRQLLIDLEHEFPGVRIRVVIPPSQEVVHAVRSGLDQMPKPGAGSMERTITGISEVP